MGLSARGSRHIGNAEEKIDDPAELAQVGRQARAVRIKSLVAGLALTIVALALP